MEYCIIIIIFRNAVSNRAPPQKCTKVLSNKFYFCQHVSTTVFGHLQDNISETKRSLDFLKKLQMALFFKKSEYTEKKHFVYYNE